MRTTTRKGGAHVRRDNDRLEDHDVVGTRDRFGGLDLPAAFAGAMAALGMLALLGAVASAWFSNQSVTLSSDGAVSATGVIAGLAIVVASCLFGGWVTGRTARYNGTGNGLLTGLLLVLFAGGLGALAGSTADVSFTMPSWITADAGSNQAITTAVVAGLVALLVCAMGGALGSAWHRRVDRSLVTETENSAFAPYPEDKRLVTKPSRYEDTNDESDAEADADAAATSSRTGRTRRSS